MGLDIVLIVLGSLLILAGLVGCIVPVLPGPPISFAGIVVLHFTSFVSFSATMFIFLAGLAIVATVLDFIVPVWGTKKAGGSKWGVRGAAIGLIIGLLFGGSLGQLFIPVLAPLAGMIIGPFLGALLGEILYMNKKGVNDFGKALVAAIGSFLGLMLGIVIKLAVSSFIAFIFVRAIIINL